MKCKLKERGNQMICKLKEIRKIKNITQREIASKLKIKQTTISEWENNNTVPNLKTAYKLADYLKVQVIDIWK